MDTGIIFLFAILIVLVAIILTVLLLRFTFRVKRQLWNQKQQITILLKIAKQLGVPDDEELENIKTWNNHNSDEYLKL